MQPSGKYNRRIIIRRADITRTSSGMPSETWRTVTTVWGAIRTLTAIERISANQEYATATVEIAIRYRRAISARDRLMAGTREYDIKGIIDVDDRHEELLLICGDITDVA